MGQGFRTNGQKVGWKNDVQGREKAYAALDWCSLPDRLLVAAERLRGVQIECMPAADLMKRFNNSKVLIYLDPPYILRTRHGKQYCHEMCDDDHIDLLTCVLDHKGPVLISGYESDLYNDMLRGWHKESTFCYSQVNQKKKEVLWMNFEPEMQMKLDI